MNKSSIRQKIKIISDKWQRVVKDLNQDKLSRVDILNKKLQSITYPSTALNSLEQKIDNVQVPKYAPAYEIQNKFRKLNDLIITEVDSWQQLNTNQEQKIIDSISDQNLKIQLNLERNGIQQERSLCEQLDEVSHRIASISARLTEEQKDRTAALESLGGYLTDEFQDFRDKMAIEKRIREETDVKIKSMITGVHGQLQVLMDEERRNRELMSQVIIMSDYYLADDFLALRKASVIGYKKLCNAILKIKNPRELLRAGLCILQTEPNDRQDVEVQILEKATDDLQFFRDLNDERIHYQCCKMMRYRSYERNQIVFRQGETSTEFFIIIEGTVNVYVAKPHEEIAQLIHADKILMKGLSQEDKQRHHSQIVENYQLPPQLPQFQKQFTICLNDDGIQAIKKAINMRSSIKIEEQQQEETEEQVIVKKVTNGIDSFEDKAFFFKNGIFLHNYITTIGEGAIFGERGLMIESKRTGTVVASSDLQVVYLTKQDYKVILETNQLDKIRKKIRLLCNHFLSQTTYKEAIQCQYLFEKIKYPMGSNVYRDNSSDQNIYIIKKGTVKVLRTISRQQLPLCELGTEQYFGDIEYFEKCKRYHTILVTCRKLSLYKISFTDVQKLFSICSGVEPMLLKNYEQRKLVDIDRVNQQSKLSKLVENQKKLSLKHLNRHDKLLPSTMLEEIYKKNEQLQSLRKLQRIKNKSQPQTLASVLISLDKQARLFKREERKQEILRFSQFEKKMSRCNSVANQEPQTQLTSPTNSIISSKHNLFRQKPTKIFLMSHYEHKIPRTLSQDIISSLQFDSPSKTQFR